MYIFFFIIIIRLLITYMQGKKLESRLMRSVIQIPFYFGKLKLNLVLNTLKKM